MNAQLETEIRKNRKQVSTKIFVKIPFFFFRNPNPGISFQAAVIARHCVVGGEGREKFKGTLSLLMGQTCGCSSKFEPSHEIVGQGHAVLAMKPYLGLSKKDVDKMYEFFLRIDLDANPHLAEAYAVQGVPVFALFVKGKETWRHSGVIDAKALQAAVEDAL